MKKGDLIVASSEESADLLYACAFKAPDPFIYFSVGKKRVIVVSPLEYTRACNESKREVEVFNSHEFSGEESDIAKTLLDISREFGVDRWRVPGVFPLKYADILREKGVEIECSKGEFFPQRECKQAYELRAIKDALALTEKAMQKACNMIAESSVDTKKRLIWNGTLLSSEILQSEIDIEVKRGGGNAFSTIAACGLNAAEPHNRGSGTIESGKCIVVDIFPRMESTGYWGDMTRTFLKGRAPVRLKRAFDAVKEAKDVSSGMLREGVLPSEAYQVACNILEKRGFKTGTHNGVHFGFIHSLGHGVGLDIHESPRLSPMNPKPLKAGNIVTVEPGLYYPEWGGVRLEDMVLIEKDSSCCLNTMESVLEIP